MSEEREIVTRRRQCQLLDTSSTARTSCPETPLREGKNCLHLKPTGRQAGRPANKKKHQATSALAHPHRTVHCLSPAIIKYTPRLPPRGYVEHLRPRHGVNRDPKVTLKSLCLNNRTHLLWISSESCGFSFPLAALGCKPSLCTAESERVRKSRKLSQDAEVKMSRYLDEDQRDLKASVRRSPMDANPKRAR